MTYDGMHLEIRLLDVAGPPVWRRVAVPSDISLGVLHEVVQAVMGWEDAHLHVFGHGAVEYGEPDPEFDRRDESTVPVSRLLTRAGDKLRYTYDFGDSWEHAITLVGPLPVGDFRCTAGKGACPPEDCGGAEGYAALKATLADPTAEDHEDVLAWMALLTGADFDPAAFSLDNADRALAGVRARR